MEDAQKESDQIREQTQRAVEGRVAAAEKAAAEVLEEARTLHNGMRRLGEALTDSAERILRDVQAAHKRMQADLRVAPDLGRAPAAAHHRVPREPAPFAESGRPQRERAHHRRGRGGTLRERVATRRRRAAGEPVGGNPFDDLDVPNWVQRDR